MAKRKCGTCRYFRDAGVACSGWCTHPERGDLHDLVLVRRAELACRNSWDQDLWQLRQPGTGKELAAIAEPEIPRTLDTPGAQSRSGVLPENPTDRVTSITISQIRRSREQFTPPAVTGGQPNQDVTGSRPERVQTANSAKGGVSALEPGFERAVRASNPRRTVNPGSAGANRSLKLSSPDEVDERSPVRSDAAGFSRPRRSLSPELASDTSPLPVDEVNRLFAQSNEVDHTGAPRLAKQTAARPASNDTSSTVSRVHVDGIEFSSVTAHDKFTSLPGDSRLPGPAPIDETKWVAGIPRSCDTCREFQRAADGRTGLCGNNYAFSRPTVVECDELACRSSVSVWWLPSDDFWLERAEIAHHTRPTPFLDAVLSELRPGAR